MSSNQVDTTLSLLTPSADMHAPNPNTSNANSSRNRKKKFKPTSSPMFISAEVSHKFARNKLQPGCLIQLARDSEIFAMFAHANWTAMLTHPSRKVLPNMVAEFYGNMGVGKGVNEVFYLTSVINGCPILVDHLLLGRVLKLNSFAMSMSPIDVGKDFTFNSDEQKLFLTVFCGIEWHQDALVTDKKVSYEHFTPMFQNLALILRTTVFPSQNPGKMMSFVEMKIMYKLFSKKVDFNLAYMILTKMISAAKMGYMPYGLLLTQLFEHFKFDTSIPPFFHVSNSISDKTTRVCVPLPELIAPVVLPSVVVRSVTSALPDTVTDIPAMPAVVHPVVDSVNVPTIAEPGEVPTALPLSSVTHSQLSAYFSVLVKLTSKVSDMETEFKDLEGKFVGLSEKYTQLLEKVDLLMTILSSVMGRVSAVETNLSQLVQFQIELNTPSSQAPQRLVIEDIDSDLVVVDAMDAGDAGNGNGSGTVPNDAMMVSVINTPAYNQVD